MEETTTGLPKIQNTEALWQNLKLALKKEFGEDSYNSWLSKLNLVSLDKNEITMSVNTAFIRDWITKEFLDGKKRKVDGENVWIKKGIKQIFTNVCSDLKIITIIVDKSNTPNPVTQEFENNLISLNKTNLHTFDLDLNPNFTFENFVVGTSNNIAYSVAKSLADFSDSSLNANPFFIYGEVGLGKTHLIQAMASHINKNFPHKKVLYLSAERFMHQFIQSLKNQDTVNFKERFRSVDILMIDDIQFIANKENTQKEFINTFNALTENNKQIVLGCDKCPSDLTGIDEKLKSRINGGIIADIFAPDYDLRLKIARKKAELLGINCSDEIYKFIAEKVQTNGRDIEGALKKILIHQKFARETVNLLNVEIVLKDFLKITSKVITINKIKNKTANLFDINVEDLCSIKRDKKFVLPRQVAIYLAKNLTTKSLADIGLSFGGKNHATVIHSIKKIENLCKKDSEIQLALNKLNSQL